MTIALNTAIRTANMQNNITASGANAKLKYYNGTRPASGAAITSQTLLGTLNFGATIGTAANGTLDWDEAGVTQNNASHVAGTPTWFRLTTSADGWVADGSIPADMTFAGTIAPNVDITLGTSVWTADNA